MHVVRSVCVAALMVVLAGCDQGAPTEGSESPDLHLGAGGGRGRDRGAHFVRGEVSTPSGAGLRVVTMNALVTPRGKVKGGYRVDLTASGAFFEVGLSCLVVDGNTAWLAGHITATNSPAIVVGSVSYFYAIDNGRPHPRREVPPDVISTARINDALGQDVEFCTLRPLLLPQLAGLEGDLTVR